MEKEAIIPSAAAAMPALGYGMATMVYFQFVFAAITPIILLGAILGRVSFKAWVIFVPLWTTFIYSVGAYSLWGGGWLGSLGVLDYSGGYVIHLASAFSGFTAAPVIGPRIARDRESFHPNSLLITAGGAGLLWLGWSGFNGGDPFTANADAGAGVLNTHTATAAALLTWVVLGRVRLWQAFRPRRRQWHDHRPGRHHPGRRLRERHRRHHPRYRCRGAALDHLELASAMGKTGCSARSTTRSASSTPMVWRRSSAASAPVSWRTRRWWNGTAPRTISSASPAGGMATSTR